MWAVRSAGGNRDRNIRVLPVPMRIEDGEKEKLDVGRAQARTKFEGFPAGMTPEGSAMYWPRWRSRTSPSTPSRKPGHVRRRPWVAGLPALLV